MFPPRGAEARVCVCVCAWRGHLHRLFLDKAECVHPLVPYLRVCVTHHVFARCFHILDQRPIPEGGGKGDKRLRNILVGTWGSFLWPGCLRSPLTCTE